MKVKNLIYGGGQQGGMRSGTENVAGVAAMGLAAKMLYQDFDKSIDRLYGLREKLLVEIADIPDLRVNGPKGRECAPHIISLTVPGVRAEVLLHALEERGVYVSSGSACASNKPHTSATLEAIGLPRPYLDNTIRISLSEMTTEEDILQASAALHEIIPFLRKSTPRSASRAKTAIYLRRPWSARSSTPSSLARVTLPFTGPTEEFLWSACRTMTTARSPKP